MTIDADDPRGLRDPASLGETPRRRGGRWRGMARPDLGYAWRVYAARDDLPPVAQGYSAKVSTAETVAELILISEGLADRVELDGPDGKTWTCRLGTPAAEHSGLPGGLFPDGYPRWEPERPR